MHISALLYKVIGIIIALVLSGCATTSTTSLMPSGKKEVIGGAGWKSYDDAKKAYSAIVINKTTREQLRGMGVAIDGPNVYAFSQPELIQKFLQGSGGGARSVIKLTDEIMHCMDYTQKKGCEGYEISAYGQEKTGEGSLFLRVTGFRSEDRLFDWIAKLFIVLHDDVVIYAALSGTPTGNVSRDSRKDPLGPVRMLRDFKSD